MARSTSWASCWEDLLIHCIICWKHDRICPFQTVQDIVRFLRDGGKTDDADDAAGWAALDLLAGTGIIYYKHHIRLHIIIYICISRIYVTQQWLQLGIKVNQLWIFNITPIDSRISPLQKPLTLSAMKNVWIEHPSQSKLNIRNWWIAPLMQNFF